MKIGVLSDTHDHLTRIKRALDLFRDEQVDLVLHPGDICSPFAAKALKRWEGPMRVIYGNNDGERQGLAEIFPDICDGPVRIEADGITISMDHYPPDEQHRPLSGANVILFGHTHDPIVEEREGVVYLNAGECCGWLKGEPTVAILRSDPLEARIIPLEG